MFPAQTPVHSYYGAKNPSHHVSTAFFTLCWLRERKSGASVLFFRGKRTSSNIFSSSFHVKAFVFGQFLEVLCKSLGQNCSRFSLRFRQFLFSKVQSSPLPSLASEVQHQDVWGSFPASKNMKYIFTFSSISSLSMCNLDLFFLYAFCGANTNAYEVFDKSLCMKFFLPSELLFFVVQPFFGV